MIYPKACLKYQFWFKLFLDTDPVDQVIWNEDVLIINWTAFLDESIVRNAQYWVFLWELFNVMPSKTFY